ncbi:hypothetical protein EIC00_20820 [Vibrio parahaemolyticus]|nr:hypothetical protein [Vibrio parahaemolyticus]EGR3234399.1 hypothetical protein [Vibrio parahaemolyticus]
MPIPKNEWPKRLNLEKPKNFPLSHNAALSGEQRDHNPKPLRLKHKTQPRAKTPKRWESVLNALLYSRFHLASSYIIEDFTR